MEKTLEFKGIICSYRTMILTVKDSLQIRYEHPQTYDIFEARFFKDIRSSTNVEAAQNIKTIFNNNFKNCFNYIKLYHEDQNRIQILDSQFTIKHYKRKDRKDLRLIRFEGKKMLSEHQMIEEKKVEQEVTDVQAQNVYLKQTMKQLQLACLHQGQQIQQLKHMVLASKKDYLKYLKADTQVLAKDTDRNSNIKRIQSLDQLSSAIKDIKSTIKGLIERVDQQEVSIPDVQEDDYEWLQKYGMRHWVNIDLNNKFIAEYYEVEDSTVRRIGKYQTVQILGKDPFPLKGRHYFSLYLEIIHWSIFSVGVVKQSRRNYLNSHQNKDCISLFARDGMVWNNGVATGGGPYVPEKVELIVVVDYFKKLVKWYQEGKEIASSRIQPHMLNVRLVPCLHLNYEHDTVVFNTRKSKNMQQ